MELSPVELAKAIETSKAFEKAHNVVIAPELHKEVEVEEARAFLANGVGPHLQDLHEGIIDPDFARQVELGLYHIPVSASPHDAAFTTVTTESQ